MSFLMYREQLHNQHTSCVDMPSDFQLEKQFQFVKCLWRQCMCVPGCVLQIQCSAALKRHLKILLESTAFVLLSADIVRYNGVHYTPTLDTLAFHYMLQSRHFGYSQRPLILALPLPLNLPYGWLLGRGRRRRQLEIGCFKAECCKACIVSFPLTLKILLCYYVTTLKIVLVTF